MTSTSEISNQQDGEVQRSSSAGLPSPSFDDERVKEIRERWSAVYSFEKHRLHTAMLTHDGRPSRDSASLIHSAGADIDYLLSQLSLQPAASTPTDLAAEMETVDSLLAKVSEARVRSDYPTYGEINECRKAIRRIVAATAASTEAQDE